MTKYILLLLSLLFINDVVLAQKEYPVRASSKNPFWELQSRAIEIESANEFFGDNPNSVDNIEGSPYANKEFVFGKLYINGELSKKNVLLRYNILSEEIEISTSKTSTEDTYDALFKDPAYHAKIGNTIYIFANYQDSADDGGYFSFLESGSVFDFYKKMTVTFTPAKESRPYRPAIPAKFEKDTHYYLVSKEGNFFKLPNKKARLIKAMGDKEEEIEAFIKSRNLVVENEVDMIALFKYYDGLLSSSNPQ